MKDLLHMKNRSILIVTLHLKNGGAERVFSELMNSWANDGCNICVVQLCKDLIPGDNYKISKGIEIINLETDHQYNSLLGKIEIIPKLVKLFKRKSDYTILSFVNPATYLVAISSFFIKNKIVFSERCDPTHSPSNKFKRLLRTLAFYRADACVFQTVEARNYFPNIIVNKSTIIPNPIVSDLPYITYNNTTRIIMACTLNEQKNLKMAIDAFSIVNKQNNELYLDIFGQGNKYDEINNYINDLGLNNKIHLKGYCTDIHKEMANSYLFLSSSNYEGISNSILEAMAIGLPCICTDCPSGGTGMLIDDDVNGILVPVNNALQMAKEIIRVINNPDIYKKISNNAKKVRNTYNIDDISKEWLKVV